MNFGELKSNAADFMDRGDISAGVLLCITLAEADIRRDIRMRENEATTTLTLTTRTVAVPSGFLAVKRLVMNSTVDAALDYLPPDRLYSSNVYHDSGTPKAYTIEGTNFIFAPEPSGSPEALLHYYKAFDVFAADADENALSINYPGAYLFGTLKHAGLYLRDKEQVVTYATAYNEEVAKINAEARRGRQGMRLRRTGMPAP